jgi:hypothetical protein
MRDTGGGGDRLSRLAAGHRVHAARSGLYCLAPLLHPRQSRGLGWCAEVVRQSWSTARSAVQAVGLWLLAARLFDFGEGLSVSTGREDAKRLKPGATDGPGWADLPLVMLRAAPDQNPCGDGTSRDHTHQWLLQRVACCYTQ